MKILFFLGLLGSSSGVFALEGAKTLLEKASEFKKDKSTLEDVKAVSRESLNYYTGFKIDNPFSAYIFTVLRKRTNNLDQFSKWMALILTQDFKKAAELIPALEKNMENESKNSFAAMKTYVYWKSKFSHSFLDSWFKSNSSKSTAGDESFKILDEFLTPHGGSFVAQNPLVFTVSQISFLKSEANQTDFGKEMRNIFLLRSGKISLDTLNELPKGHSLEIPMGYSAAFYLAQNGRIGDAGKILKSRLEPAIEAKADIKALSKYYLLIARLLFQAKAYKAAKNYYERIPNGDQNYLQAQAELTWVRLHLGDTAELRGKLESLTSPLFRDRFIPESYIVRAISNLRLCRYGKVWEDFDGFIENNKKWASRISAGLAGKDYEMAYGKGFYIRRLEESAQFLSNEKKILNEFSQNKPFWKAKIGHLNNLINKSESNLTSEYKRHYRSLDKKLRSAILKMRFVKIETLDQIQKWSRQVSKADVLEDKISTSQAAVTNDKLVFPYDGVFWPDEVFKLRSLAETQCKSSAGVNK